MSWTDEKVKVGIIIGSEKPIQTATECSEAAVRAEKDGFYSVWIPDHLTDIDGSLADPWVTLAYIAAKTEKIRLYTGVTDFQKIHPAKLAQLVATLDELSNGRITVGIGSGEVMNITPYGIEWDEVSVRLKRLEEYIQVMRLIWQSNVENPVTFNGAYYQLKDAWIDQKVTQKPYPPIVIGAFGTKKMRDLIGRVGDGWFPFILTSEMYKERLNNIREIAKQANRNPNAIEAVSPIFTVVSSDPKIIADMTNTFKAYAATTARGLLKSLGVELPQTKLDTNYQVMILSKSLLDEIDKVAEAVPDWVIPKISAGGTVEEVLSFIEERISAGANHLVMNPSQGIMEDNWKAITQEIIPYIKKKYS
jgi:alkanesulfonate monooxygenase SsuD/methylene tetrahydromethanopterin reductase-like flavin-dependent oxidoreductase (luciferase family)